MLSTNGVVAICHAGGLLLAIERLEPSAPRALLRWNKLLQKGIASCHRRQMLASVIDLLSECAVQLYLNKCNVSGSKPNTKEAPDADFTNECEV